MVEKSTSQLLKEMVQLLEVAGTAMRLFSEELDLHIAQNTELQNEIKKLKGEAVE